MQNKVKAFTAILVLASAVLFHAISPAPLPASYISNGGGSGSLPSQSGNSGKFLQTDGTNATCCLSWATAGGGGTGGGTGTLGTRPAASTLGNNSLYFATDSAQLSRSDGTNYAVWGPIWPLGAPDNSVFSWVNQGTATLSTNGGALMISAPASVGQDAKLRVRSLPAAPYTVTVMLYTGLAGINYSAAGLVLRESGSGKLVVLYPVSDSGRTVLAVGKYNSPTSYNGNYTSANTQHSRQWCLQFSDDLTNRIARWSPDCLNYIQLHSVGRTDFITPDQYGYYADSNTSNNPVYVSLISITQS